MSAPAAARLHDPVAHSHALGGFLAGAAVGIAAAAGVAILVGMAATAVAVEIATAGLATPLVAGVAVTAAEFAINYKVGGAIMGFAEGEGERLGSESMGAASGQVTHGSPDVRINNLAAGRVTDAEDCHAGEIAQGSATVYINNLPAARVRDKVTCGATIMRGSHDVFIGGPTETRGAVQSEVPAWARWAAVVAGILPALGGLARAVGPAIAEVQASGFARAAQTGVKALGRAMEERAGGARPPAAAAPAVAAEDAAAGAAAKLERARTPAEIEEAREALKQLPYDQRKAVLDDFAGRMDVSTKPNTATFWSGGRLMPTGPGGAPEWNSARSWAEASRASGRATLESTTGGRVLDKVDVFRSSDPLLKPADAGSLWDTASARYTEGATGEIHAYLDNPRAASIYNTTERPSILNRISSGQVSDLKEFDIANYHDWMTR